MVAVLFSTENCMVYPVIIWLHWSSTLVVYLTSLSSLW